MKKRSSNQKVIVDIDVDYFAEMQKECYTPWKNAPLKELGQLIKVKKIIRKTEPSLITISEATINSMNNKNSNISNFIKYLKNLGYEIKYHKLYENDEIAKHLLKIYENYQHNIMEPLEEKFGYNTINEEFFKEMVKETKNYFKNIEL